MRKNLIENYIDGWKNGDVEKVLDTLSEDCVIIESHGPMFTGKDQIRDWITKWNERESKIKEWNVTNIVRGEDASAIEWDFECCDRGQEYKFSGASILTFRDGLISEIREFMRTKDPYQGV